MKGYYGVTKDSKVYMYLEPGEFEGLPEEMQSKIRRNFKKFYSTWLSPYWDDDARTEPVWKIIDELELPEKKEKATTKQYQGVADELSDETIKALISGGLIKDIVVLVNPDMGIHGKNVIESEVVERGRIMGFTQKGLKYLRDVGAERSGANG